MDDGMDTGGRDGGTHMKSRRMIESGRILLKDFVTVTMTC